MAALKLLVHGGTKDCTAHRNSYSWLRSGNGPLLLPFNSRDKVRIKVSGVKGSVKGPLLCHAKAVDIASSDANPKRLSNLKVGLNSAIGGMMCGGCAARVRNPLLSDPRVEFTAVNMVTEMAAVRLKSGADLPDITAVADELARRLKECGFPSKKREKGSDIMSNVKKWQELLKKKEESLRRSRNRVAFAWTLVALCCGTHGAHLLHSVGIHVAHGSFWGILENVCHGVRVSPCGTGVLTRPVPQKRPFADPEYALSQSINQTSIFLYAEAIMFFIKQKQRNQV